MLERRKPTADPSVCSASRRQTTCSGGYGTVLPHPVFGARLRRNVDTSGYHPDSASRRPHPGRRDRRLSRGSRSATTRPPASTPAHPYGTPARTWTSRLTRSRWRASASPNPARSPITRFGPTEPIAEAFNVATLSRFVRLRIVGQATAKPCWVPSSRLCEPCSDTPSASSPQLHPLPHRVPRCELKPRSSHAPLRRQRGRRPRISCASSLPPPGAGSFQFTRNGPRSTRPRRLTCAHMAPTLRSGGPRGTDIEQHPRSTRRRQ